VGQFEKKIAGDSLKIGMNFDDFLVRERTVDKYRGLYILEIAPLERRKSC
jgi:hypothetical protein